MTHAANVHHAADPLQMRLKLREHFGFKSFRPGQAEAVAAAIEGRNTIVVMPTGSGKSLCFQLPALELVGTTVVVSPLIALMKDQADRLRSRGIAVSEINSTLPAAVEREELAAIGRGEREFVYTTPERLARRDFREILKQTSIDLFVVDEAHCASQWGHDFRPEYMALAEAIEDLGSPTVLAMTATATPDVIDDIRHQLGIDDAEIVHMGIERPNLSLEAIQVTGEYAKLREIAQLLDAIPGTGIIYTATVKATKALTASLQEAGVEAACYHGQMKCSDRTATQDRFMRGDLKVMVATNAFGLGIDKPDIRFVIHHHVPPTIEAYYQEAGRAGRDGEPARCILLFDPSDRALLNFFQAGRYPSGEDLVNAHHAVKRLVAMDKDHTFEELTKISPLGKVRLKQALNLLKQKHVVREDKEGLHLLLPDLSPDALERLAGSARERDERDRIKQQQMLDFVEIQSCRWMYLHHYFELVHEVDHGNHDQSCGRCDRCRPNCIAA